MRSIARRKTWPTNEAGFALLTVMGISLALLITSLVVMSGWVRVASMQRRMAAKADLAPKTEALARAVFDLSKAYLEAKQPIDHLQEYLDNEVGTTPTLIPDGTQLRTLEVTFRDKRSIGRIKSGQLANMDAEQFDVFYTISLADANDPSTQETVSMMGSVNGVSFLQFSEFHFGKGWFWAPRSPGRVHVNGDSCIGLPDYWGTAVGTYITVAGKIYEPNSPQCGNGSFTGLEPFNLWLEMDPTTHAKVKVDWNALSDCTNCAGTGLNWKEYALATYEGRLKDESHDVKMLNILPQSIIDDASIKMPGTWGNNTTLTGKAWWAAGNNKERLILDPVLPNDPQPVKDSKFAYEADIRIINGVWYLKNPNDPNDWPGIPVWSDHPGSFETEDKYEGGLIGETSPGVKRKIRVGQADIAAYWNSRGYSWTSGPPKLYSYYRFDGNLQPNTQAVISYGNLKRSTPGSWKPGFLVSSAVNPSTGVHFADAVCQPTQTCTNCGSSNEMKDATDPAAVTCQGGSSPAPGTQILFGTRSGYRNGEFQKFDYSIAPSGAAGDAIRAQRAKTLPMNFDVAAFHEAMKCAPSGHPAEIGCFFGANKFMGRSFNGVVFVTTTWDNWNNEAWDSVNDTPCDYWTTPLCPGSSPGRMMPLPPFQGSVPYTNDANQASISHPGQQEALPYPLCGASGVGGVAGQPFDASPAQARFKVPNCADYAAGAAQYKVATPTEVRFFNFSTVDKTVFSRGLSLISNAPVSLLGNVNSSSDTSGPRAQPWVPVLLGADTARVVSNNWQDENAPWDRDTTDPSVVNNRIGTDIIVNASYLTQFSPASLENMSGRTRTITGARLSLGEAHYYFVPYNQPDDPATGARWSTENVTWDPHLKFIEYQPPGIPMIQLFTLKSMKWGGQR